MGVRVAPGRGGPAREITIVFECKQNVTNHVINHRLYFPLEEVQNPHQSIRKVGMAVMSSWRSSTSYTDKISFEITCRLRKHTFKDSYLKINSTITKVA